MCGVGQRGRAPPRGRAKLGRFPGQPRLRCVNELFLNQGISLSPLGNGFVSRPSDDDTVCVPVDTDIN